MALRGAVAVGVITSMLLAWPSAVHGAWTQDHIVTSFWVDPVIPVGQFPEVYKQIKAANFTTVLGGFGDTTPSTLAAQLQASAKYGLEVMPPVAGHAIDQLPNGTYGFQIKDEPSTSDFPALANTTAAIAERFPNALSFINLLPTYASPSQMGAATYDDYVASYVEVVKPQFLCMDHYPQMSHKADTRSAYIDNLAVLRKYGQQAGIPWWNFFTAMPFDGRLDVSEAQMRWMAFASLASGARGLLYFCLWTPPGGDFQHGGAIFTPVAPATNQSDVRYVKGPHYDHATAINSVAAAWSPFLMNATVTGTFRVLPQDVDPANPLSGCALVNVSAGSDVFVGQFHLPPSSTLVLVLSWDTGYVSWPTLTFNVSDAGVREVSKSAGTADVFMDDSPHMPGLQARFAPGDARLFVV